MRSVVEVLACLTELRRVGLPFDASVVDVLARFLWRGCRVIEVSYCTMLVLFACHTLNPLVTDLAMWLSWTTPVVSLLLYCSSFGIRR
jgi:hypothetical protein